jgi:hypothetical protein
MKGLLLKDILNLKQQGKIYLLIVGIWLVIGAANRDSVFFGGVMMILTVLVPISALAYDDKAKWDKYALTMPISKTDLVLSKYILMLACAIAGAFISEIVSVVITKDVRASLTTTMVFMSTGIILASIVLPIIFKFGTEKGRLIMLVVGLLPTVAVMLLPKLGVDMPEEKTIENMIPFLPFAAIAVTAVSVFVSRMIYDRKEF